VGVPRILRLFHSPTRRDFLFCQEHSFRTVAPEMLGAVSNSESSVQVLVHGERASGQGGAPAHRFNLQAQILNAHGVISIHRTFELQREDQVEVSAGAAHKRTATLCRRDLETPIELSHVVLAQEAIGRFQAADSA